MRLRNAALHDLSLLPPLATGTVDLDRGDEFLPLKKHVLSCVEGGR